MATINLFMPFWPFLVRFEEPCSMTYQLAVFAFDGCFVSGITGPLDAFNIANTHQRVLHGETPPLFSWKIYSPDGQPVRTSTGLLLPVDGSVDELTHCDIGIVPGVDHIYGTEVIERARLVATRIGPVLKRLHDHRVTLASNCSGAFIFAEAGLLLGKEATTSWWLARHFQALYPRTKLKLNKLVTEDGNICCSGAVTSYLHQCIRLIEKFAGSEIANRCARTMLLQTKGASQAPYIGLNDRIDKLDDVVQQAVVWMSENMHTDINIDQLASDLAVSPRTFIRRFNLATGKPPKQYLQKLRINEAKQLLETTTLTIDQITQRVGYADVSSFRRLFKREVDLSPTEYRKRFSQLEVGDHWARDIS
jgi:transcriptional regulator GlxA family with amidase domain